MRFNLIDAVLEQSPDRIVAMKQVSQAEEYLADHFPSFPVLPGVLMLEAMAQAARQMLKDQAGAGTRLVIAEVKALKFGNMVRPGEALRIEVSLQKANDDGSFTCRGVGTVRRADAAASEESGSPAVSGRFTLRPMRAS